MSTGSPLSPESFDFVYEAVKKDVCLSSITGGTDILGCFALGNPILPVWRGEIQCKALGLAVDVFDGDVVRLVVSPLALDPLEVTVEVNSGSRLGGC